MQISPTAVPHVVCGLIHLNLLAKTTTKLFLVGILFLLFLCNFEFVLGFLYFPREAVDIMYEDLLYSCYSLPFKFSGKVLPVTLTLLCFSFIFYIPTRFYWVVQTKSHLDVRSPSGGNAVNWKRLKYCWSMYLSHYSHSKQFVAKTDIFSLTHWKTKKGGVFNRQYILHLLADWKKYIMVATIPRCSIQG